MPRRLVGLCLAIGLLAACGGGSAPANAPATAAPGATAAAPAATDAPAASSGEGGAVSWLPDGKAGLQLSVDGKETIYTVTCTIEGADMAETSIKVDGKNGSDTAAFYWVPGKMPYIEGSTGGTAWKAEDLSASRSFASVQAWSFSGTMNETDGAVEGTAICK